MKAPLQGLSWPALLTASVSQERKKMEEIMAGLQRRHENEVADLHATVERLLKVGCVFFFISQTAIYFVPPWCSLTTYKKRRKPLYLKSNTQALVRCLAAAACFLGKCDGPCRQIKSCSLPFIHKWQYFQKMSKFRLKTRLFTRAFCFSVHIRRSRKWNVNIHICG